MDLRDDLACMRGKFHVRTLLATASALRATVPVVEYDGVRIDLTGIAPWQREQLESVAQLYIDAGMRPPMLTVKADGVDVSKEPHLWPASVRDYRGPGRLEPI